MIKILKENDMQCFIAAPYSEDPKIVARYDELENWRNLSPIQRIEKRASELLAKGYVINGTLEHRELTNAKTAYGCGAAEYTLIMIKKGG